MFVAAEHEQSWLTAVSLAAKGGSKKSQFEILKKFHKDINDYIP